MDKNGKGLLNIIGSGSVFEGTINVPHSIRIDGSFKGKVQTAESITIGETGVVEAEIKGQNAFIFGKVLGNMYVDERVELHTSAVVVGDLHAKELVIKEGAIYHGHCSMQKGHQTAIGPTGPSAASSASSAASSASSGHASSAADRTNA